jgi:hypothetical protein
MKNAGKHFQLSILGKGRERWFQKKDQPNLEEIASSLTSTFRQACLADKASSAELSS